MWTLPQVEKQETEAWIERGLRSQALAVRQTQVPGRVLSIGFDLKQVITPFRESFSSFVRWP